MLSLLRRKAQSPIIQATVVIIALVFIFWGVGSSRRNGGKPVAEVNDFPILYQDFQRAYDNTINQYREQFGGSIPSAILKQLNLEEQVLDQLINGTLLRQGAAEMGIIVSDAEVKSAVREVEAFRTNGIFDISRYEAILSSSRMTPAIYENSMRNDLLTAKVTDYLSRFAKVPPTELRERFIFANEELKLAYVTFTAQNFEEEVQPTDEEIAGYYEEHKQTYKTAPQIKLQYLAFRYDDADAAAQVSDQEIQEYYRNNINTFTTPELRKARHILIKTDPTDSPEELAAKRARTEEILAMARNGEDFATLAKEHSEGPSAPMGGDLGEVEQGRMVPSFDAALFAMQEEGAISDLVETQFGYHIIKLEEILPAGTKELAEVRDEIVAVLAQSRSKSATFTRASKAYEEIILAGSLAAYENSKGVKAEETEFFSRQSPPGEPGALVQEPAFLNAAFALNEGELSSLIELDQGYAILYAGEFREPQVASLEEVGNEVRRDLVREKAKELARLQAANTMDAVKAAGREVSAWNETLAGMGLTPTESDLITRSGALESGTAELPATVVRKGFSLSENAPYPDEVVANNTTYYVFRYLEHRLPGEEVMATAEGDFRDRLLEQKKAELFTAWLANRRDRAEISIDERFLTTDS